MNVILGVDIGGSTTKIVAFEEKQRVLDCMQVRAGDQITSLYGAIGHILYKCHLTLEQVTAFVLTGVGATMVKGDIYGIPTYRVKEFEAIGKGALELTGLKDLRHHQTGAVCECAHRRSVPAAAHFRM